jgi:hypothetical protein
MWPFATRGSRFLGDAAARHPSRTNPGDFARNDAMIKLWLPENLLAAIDVLCDVQDASRPDVLRGILFEYAYGRTELAHLRRSAPVQQSEAKVEEPPDVRDSPRRHAA